MFSNYIKVAWRNITRHRVYSAVNVIGLFAGISFALLIGAYIWSELRVNRQLRNANRQFILTTVSTDPNVGYELATFAPLAKRLKDDYPALVENYYRYDGITSVISKGEKHFREGLQVGDSTMLKMFGFEKLHGDINTALNEPYSVVITEDKAIKYFGKTDVVGELISIQSFSGGSHNFKITAVLKELHNNSITHLTKDYPNSFFIPLNTLSYFGRGAMDFWNNMQIASYIELKEGVAVKDLEKPIQQLLNQNISEALQKIVTVKPVLLSNYYLQKEQGIVKRMLYTLSFTGLFILLMAVVNFITIAISRSGSRMKEIGIRKVLGSLRRQLIFQFLAESIILVSVATVLAILVYPYARPWFNQIVGTDIPELADFPSYFIFLPVMLITLVGILAGLYPALVLSSLKSVDSLKGKLRTAKEKIFLRKTLVGLQFSIALVVLISAGIVTKQVAYFFSKNLGYDKEFVVSSQVPRDWSPTGVKKMSTIRNEFARLPQVRDVTLSYQVLNGNNMGQLSLFKAGGDSTQAIPMQLMCADDHYASTYGIEVKAGSFFGGSLVSESSKLVLNEKAVRALGWKSNAEAIHQSVRMPGDPTVYTVAGVTNDFLFASMKEQIPPILFFNLARTNAYRFLSFKIKPGNVNDALEAIQTKWASLLSGSSFEYVFMDDTLKKLYANELQLKKAAHTATILALIIVLLGVLGLVSLSIHKRIREISIRKVVGASLTDIIKLFVAEFAVVVIVAALVAVPVAWYLMSEWLNDYAYHVNISVRPFVIAIGVLAAVTLLLIVCQVTAAIKNNIIRNLKTE